MNFKIYNMDVFEGLKRIESNSIDCVVTSSPYWGLRDYGVDGQLGLEKHPNEYIENLVKVFAEVKKVLKPTGSVWLNMGDTYFGSWRNMSREQVKDYPKGRPPNSFPQEDVWLQPKQKMLMPHRLAIAMQEDGWILRNEVIWHKPSHMPSSVTDRLTNSFEYLFHFVKQRKYYYDLDAIREPHQASSLERDNYPRKGNKMDYDRKWIGQPDVEAGSLNPAGKNPADVWKYGSLENELQHRQGLYRGRENETVQFRPLLPTQKEFVEKLRTNFSIEEIVAKTGLLQSTVEHWFRHDENGFSFPSKEDWEKLGTDLFKRELTTIESKPAYVEANAAGKNPSDFWSINPEPFSEAHFACFPTKLVRKPLQATCPKEICKECGKARERILESSPEYKKILESQRGTEYYKAAARKEAIRSGNAFGKRASRLNSNYQTKGWSDCGCGKGFESGIVLDPFVGSGTTLLEAQNQGKSGIGIELNPKYIPLIKLRLNGNRFQESLNPNKIQVVQAIGEKINKH